MFWRPKRPDRKFRIEPGPVSCHAGDMSDTDYARIERAILYLDANCQSQPSLAQVAEGAGLSEFHFQRLFRRWAGVSPKRFLQFLTAEHARRLLAESRNVLEAAYDAGLSGPSRLHDLMVNVHAMTPGEIRQGGEALEIQFGVHATPFGECLIAVTPRGICRMAFQPGDPAEDLRSRWPNAGLRENPAATRRYASLIFAAPGRARREPVDVLLGGTNFQLKVWEALLRIPPGSAATYEDLAGRVCTAAATRAVASAVARNPVAFLIPCHRVIRKTGAFGEYRWGPARKKAILLWESELARHAAGK